MICFDRKLKKRATPDSILLSVFEMYVGRNLTTAIRIKAIKSWSMSTRLSVVRERS